MKQFYVLSRVIFLVFVLTILSCEKEEAFDSPEILAVEDSSEKDFKMPNLQDVQSNFKAKTSIKRFSNHPNSSKSSKAGDLDLNIDWNESYPTAFNPETGLDILYTPIHFNSKKRIKSFIASATINDSLVSQVVTLAYTGKPSQEYFNGYIFFHDLTGAFISSSYYEFGEKIKTAYVVNDKQKSTSKSSCVEDQWYYLLEYGLIGT